MYRSRYLTVDPVCPSCGYPYSDYAIKGSRGQSSCTISKAEQNGGLEDSQRWITGVKFLEKKAGQGFLVLDSYSPNQDMLADIQSAFWETINCRKTYALPATVASTSSIVVGVVCIPLYAATAFASPRPQVISTMVMRKPVSIGRLGWLGFNASRSSSFVSSATKGQ